VPDREYAEIWARGTDEAETFGRLVGLLVSRHFTRLAGRREGLRALVEHEYERQAALTADLGLGAGTLDACSELLARWDGLSLQICGGDAPDIGRWPFAPERLELRFDARDLATGEIETRRMGMAGGGSGHPRSAP
jgi:Protein of unknown function (DUF3891)